MKTTQECTPGLMRLPMMTNTIPDLEHHDVIYSKPYLLDAAGTHVPACHGHVVAWMLKQTFCDFETDARVGTCDNVLHFVQVECGLVSSRRHLWTESQELANVVGSDRH